MQVISMNPVNFHFLSLSFFLLTASLSFSLSVQRPVCSVNNSPFMRPKAQVGSSRLLWPSLPANHTMGNKTQIFA